ncbi:hypothetical protein [Hymenobacter terrestris]|uniref:DUF3408 domain-containing protein n=1 Tax=Hymenobacter terrestris TaxID=2748310 RepID=A0ABX2Q6P1_9BACT|nr:hypothetical protein [Hymenobacter terrestris]NVO85422.1 hypothetical protein [Hymenobacter terrestris]
MAKTFKNLPKPSEAKVDKPTSERDFFDLSDDDATIKKPSEKQQTKRNTSTTVLQDNTGNTGNKIASEREADPTYSVINEELSPSGVRQTFVLSPGHLDRLRDYVHARRVKGEYNYSQKQALQEALDLLFATVDSVPPRPDQVREQQQQHGQRIRQGRQAGNSE